MVYRLTLLQQRQAGDGNMATTRYRLCLRYTRVNYTRIMFSIQEPILVCVVRQRMLPFDA